MARLLLIPKSILKTKRSNHDENIQLLAEMFEVPYSVMDQQIKEIDKPNESILRKKLTNKATNNFLN